VFIAASIIADNHRREPVQEIQVVHVVPAVCTEGGQFEHPGEHSGDEQEGRKSPPALPTRSLNHVPGASVKLRRWYDRRLCEYKKTGLGANGLEGSGGIYQMLKRGEYHRDRSAPLHEAKILHYRKFPDKEGDKL